MASDVPGGRARGRRIAESWLVVAAAAVVIVALAGVAVAAMDAESSDDGEHWQPELPTAQEAPLPEDDGVATVGDDEYDSVQAAVDAAEAGDTIELEGHFDEHVVVDTPDVTITTTAAASADSANDRVSAAPMHDAPGAAIDGGGEGTVVTVDAENVTIDGIWIASTGTERGGEHAGVFVNGSNVTVTNTLMTDVSYGVWIDGVADVTVADSVIVGQSDVHPRTNRGNGIHLWSADDAVIEGNHITEVRDGIYYSWADGVATSENVIWDVRYGVHYMYSQDNRLEGNLAFDNDVGFALMVSENLVVTNNTAIDNAGSSGHGILVKDIDDSTIHDNVVVRNENGLYVYNSHGNAITGNLIAENSVGITVTASSQGETISGNTIAENGLQAYASAGADVDWNDSQAGNYWSNARAVDLDGDGTSEIRHQPSGAVERLVHERPATAVFAESPAADVVRLVESSFPLLEDRSVVDHHPLTDSPHGNWSDHYATHDH